MVAPLAGEACETGCLAGCRAALGTVVVTLDFSSWCRRRAVRRRRAIAGGMRAQCRAGGERGVPARHRGCGCSHRVAGLAARLGKGRGRPHLVFFLGVDYDREDERRDRQRERELLEPASGQRRQGRGAHTTRTGHTASTTRYDRGAEQTPAQARSWTPRAAHARAPAHAASSAPRPPCPPPSRSAAGLPPHFVAPTWRSVVVLLHGVDEHPVRKMSRTSSSCTMPSMRILGAARLWGARRAAGTAGTVARAAASPLTGATGRRGFAEGAACPIAYRCVPCAGTQACGAAARKSATLTHRHPCLRARGPPPRRYQASALAAAQQAGRDLQARVLGRRACACAVLRCVRPGR